MDPLNIILVIALLLILGVLFVGVLNLGRKNGNPRLSNKLMRWRVGLQLFAVVLILIYVFFVRGT